LASYSIPSLYFPFNDTAFQTIPTTGIDIHTRETFMFNVNSSNISNNGIYASSQQLTPVTTLFRYLDQNGNQHTFNGLTTIACPSVGYTQSIFGYNQFLNTPCINNTVTLSTSLLPSAYTANMSFACANSFNFIVTQYMNYMNVTYTLIDSLTLNRVPNITVSVSGYGSNVTDANGTTTMYNLNPWSNPTFIQAPSGCDITLFPRAGSATFFVTLSGSGYTTKSISETYAQISNNIPTYNSSIRETITPIITTIQFHLMTND
jgi:hypothetical protein